MVIHDLHSDEDTQGFKILTKGLETIVEQDLAINYHPYYSNETSNLFYLLRNGRYKTGCYFVITEDDKYLGSAGWNLYQEEIVLCLTRAYFVPDVRHQYLMAQYLLPRIFEQTNQFNKFWITCNDYNKRIYDGLVKLHKGKSAGLYQGWPDVYKKFIPIGSMVVNNTVQYVAEYKR